MARQPQLAGLGIDLGVDVGLAAVARARRLRRSHPPWRRCTMPRSIDFSRATASAICNSSSRLALTGHRSFSLRAGRGAPGLAGLARKRVLMWCGRCGILRAPVDCRSAAVCRSRARACLPRRSDSAISASVSTSLASAISSIGSTMSAVSPVARVVAADARHVAFGAEQLAAEALAALDAPPPSRSSQNCRRSERSPIGAPAGGRCRARTSPADRRGPPDRRRRAPATARANRSSQSSIVIVPSASNT